MFISGELFYQHYNYYNIQWVMFLLVESCFYQHYNYYNIQWVMCLLVESCFYQHYYYYNIHYELSFISKVLLVRATIMCCLSGAAHGLHDKQNILKLSANIHFFVHLQQQQHGLLFEASDGSFIWIGRNEEKWGIAALTWWPVSHGDDLPDLVWTESGHSHWVLQLL